MQDEITRALGIPDLPPAQFERTRKQILEDNFFYTRCLSTLVLGVAAHVAEHLHPLEKERMRKIAGFEKKKHGGKATWGITENIIDGRIALKAACADCGQDQSWATPGPWFELIPSRLPGDDPIKKWHDPTFNDLKTLM